eukprot:2879890-Rhodomonas_salina.2
MQAFASVARAVLGRRRNAFDFAVQRAHAMPMLSPTHCQRALSSAPLHSSSETKNKKEKTLSAQPVPEVRFCFVAFASSLAASL